VYNLYSSIPRPLGTKKFNKPIWPLVVDKWQIILFVDKAAVFGKRVAVLGTSCWNNDEIGLCSGDKVTVFRTRLD